MLVDLINISYCAMKLLTYVDEFEWTATVYNLNKGKNDQLLHLCKPLGDYMTLINYIREYQLGGTEPRDAVDQAVQRCIDEKILSGFLTKHRAEVMDVCITEFNEKAYADSIRKEGRAEGQNLLVKTVQMLRDGQTEKELLDQGIDKHTIDLAMAIK